MKTIGIIGGMSFESTLNYYKWINEAVREELGELNSAEIIMRSVNFEPYEKLQRDGHWDKIGANLAYEAKKLHAMGADFIILTSNTMHKVAPQIEENLRIPFLHIADATAEAINNAGVRKVGLFGTIYTMEQDFYKQRLIDKGIDVIIPSEPYRKEINRVIFEELCKGEAFEESRSFFLKAAGEMLDQGAEGIVLGCTEVNMLIDPEDFTQPVFDTTRIHVKSAVDFSLKD